MKKSFLGSLIFHILVLVSLYLWNEKFFSESANFSHLDSSKIKVRTLSEKDLSKELKKALEAEEIQVVQTDDRLKSEAPPETSEKVFLSKTNQAVDKNTRAARVGKFKNVLKEGLTQPTSTTKSGSKKTSRFGTGVAKLFDIGSTEVSQGDEKPKETGRLFQPSRGPAAIDRGEGFSATDDYLKDVAIGAQTLLNAKEFKFYSFYERVRVRLTEQWNLELRAQIEKVLMQGSGLGGIDRTTKVVVLLDKEGQIKSTQIIATSGMEELDRAATEAFRISAPFPNPPKEMVGENDLVTLRWDFIVVSNAADGIDIQIKRDRFEGYR